jgi:hypothetical protein
MSDTALHRFPRIAPILLVAALAGLAIVRPGNLAGDAALGYRLTTTLAAVAAGCYIAWHFHGILAAAAVFILIRIADPQEPVHAAFVERQSDAIFLATIAIGIAAGSRQVGKLPWALIGIAAAATSLFGWYGLELPPADDPIARDRMRHITLLIAVLSAFVGLLNSSRWSDRLKLLAATIGMPAVGVIAFRQVHGDWPRLLEGGELPAVSSEWKNAFGNGDWGAGAWAWTVPLIVAPLMLIGVWRTLARGRTEWKAGHAPLAWLLTVATIGAFAALGARPLASGSLALAAIGALLTVFGIADQMLALVERIALRPPEPGPSGVPKVA